MDICKNMYQHKISFRRPLKSLEYTARHTLCWCEGTIKSIVYHQMEEFHQSLKLPC